MHRAWLCQKNTGALAYERSDALVPEAIAQAPSCEAFWLRGLLPAQWVSVPPPPSAASWSSTGVDGVVRGAFGTGAPGRPIWLFGDASGGPDTMSPKLRRVGLAVVSFGTEYSAVGAVFGPLVGHRQTVHRGELKSFVMALWMTFGDVIYVSDCDNVVSGWFAGQHLRPWGDDADLWAEVRDAAEGRSVTVLFTNSHLNANDVVQGRGVSWLVYGNAVVDDLADFAASEARLPQAVRSRVLLHERRAHLVRLRLLRAALDSMGAEGKKRGRVAPGVPPPPLPPAAAAVSSLLSTHSLSDCKQKCLRCFSSATKATMKQWWATDCFPLFNVDGLIMSPKIGARVHVMGGWAHPTHTLNVHTSLGVWFCSLCGAIAEKQLRSLGEPCKGKVALTKARGEYLDRIAVGLPPKVLSRAEKKARRSRNDL